MQPVQTGHARTLRLALVAVALFALLAIVAFASRSGFGHASATRPTPGYVNWAMSIFIVVFVLMIPVAIWAYSIQATEAIASREHENFGTRIAKKIVAIIVIAAAAFFIRVFVGQKFFPHFHAPGVKQPPTPHVKGGSGSAAQRVEPTFQWPVLWVTIALIVLAVAAILYRRHRMSNEAAPERRPLTRAEQVAATISDAIDDLEAESDPRRAVIAAYARMEAAFGRQGLARHRSETAIEYLRRILLGLGSRADPVTRLTGLFEQAKFSRHEIDTSMKADAIRALVEIRADLQAAT